ncbi:type 1 glutamine amidotransferase [Nocardioides sp.]|uniref:type 1 glutamine amidotransferase n=1 Tax=Nocardioides sp. TaxID=35761 RepID=UPI003528144B
MTTSHPRILVVEHEADDPPAWFGVWLEGAGCDLHVCQPWAGDALPTGLDGYAGLLVMGGWMSAHHDAEVSWLAGVKDLVREAVAARMPMFGICLGHQVATVALGGTVVVKNPTGQQIGLLPVAWTDAAAGDPLFGAVATGPGEPPRRGIHWNSDIVSELPPGASLMATAPGGEIQAARFADAAWGVQWHPEIDEPLLRRWVDEEPDQPREAGVDADQVLAEVEAARAELDAAWRPLAERFAALVTAYSTAAVAAR